MYSNKNQLMDYTISIIVPIYKVEEYLDECILSIINQTYNNLEIILVDDGSPDNCGKKCDEWAEKDNRIVVIHKQNGGLSDARNAGIDKATGQFIAFVDSDDYIAPTMYQDLFYLIIRHPNALIAASPIIRNRNGQFSTYKIGKTDYIDNQELSIKEYLKLFLGFQIDSTAWNKLYKREFISNAFKKGRNNEDYIFLYNNCKKWYDTNAVLVMCSKPHYYYRTRDNSICHSGKNVLDPLLIDVASNCIEIIDDLKLWNKDLIPVVEKRFEYAVLKAKGQMILFPHSLKLYPEKCEYINKIFYKRITVFGRKTSVMNRLKIFIFRYAPFLWKIKSKQK